MFSIMAACVLLRWFSTSARSSTTHLYLLSPKLAAAAANSKRLLSASIFASQGMRLRLDEIGVVSEGYYCSRNNPHM